MQALAKSMGGGALQSPTPPPPLLPGVVLADEAAWRGLPPAQRAAYAAKLAQVRARELKAT